MNTKNYLQHKEIVKDNHLLNLNKKTRKQSEYNKLKQEIKETVENRSKDKNIKRIVMNKKKKRKKGSKVIENKTVKAIQNTVENRSKITNTRTKVDNNKTPIGKIILSPTMEIVEDKNYIQDQYGLYGTVDDTGIRVSVKDITNAEKIMQTLDYNQVKLYAMSGCTNEEIALFIGVDKWCFQRMAVQFPRLQQFLSAGRENQIAEIVGAQHKRAVGGIVRLKQQTSFKGQPVETWSEQYIPGDTKAQQFILQNRASDKWNNANQLTIKGDNLNPLTSQHMNIDLTGYSIAELEAIAKVGIDLRASKNKNE